MPRSSRHKSHKHSKHGSKDAREYSEEEEDTKMRDFNKEESSARVSRNLGSSEKRKDPPVHSNGDVGEEYVSSKRRREKEKEKGNVSAVSDRWNGGGSAVAVEKEKKEESLRVIDSEKPSKSKTVMDSKSKSSRTHDGFGEKKEESKSEKKEESKSEKEESKRKYEKESGRKEAQQGKDLKEFKEKAKVVEKEKERKAKDIEREVEDEVVDIGDAVIPSVFFGEKKEKINVWPIPDERNLELEKDLEKRRRKKDGSNEKDKYQDDIKLSGDRRVSSREERTKGEKFKDEKYKEEKLKDVNHGDKHREDGDRDVRYKEEKYADDVDRERRYRDAKYRESSEKVNRYKDDKYREEVDRDTRLRDDKYREGGDRDNKYRDTKYRDDADKDYRRRVDKYHEDGDRNDRHKDDWYFEDSNRDGRNREEKNWEDAGRDDRHREGKQREDSVKDKRVRDVKYQDERLVRDGTKDNSDKRVRDVKYQEERLIRDGTNDNSDLKRSKDESDAVEFRHRRSNNRDEDYYDDRGTRYKDDRGKRRTGDKEDYDDIRTRSIKEQHFDMEKKSASSGKVELLGNRGKSSIRDADMVISPNHGRRGIPQATVIKQEESRYREYMHGGRERRELRDLTPAKEYADVSGLTENISRTNEKSIQKDYLHGDDVSTERRQKEDSQFSPFRKADKSPASASNDRKTLNRADIRRSFDIEDSGQRSTGPKEIKDYYNRDNRGNRDLPFENPHEDDIPQADTDNTSVSSPFGKLNYSNNNNRSLLPPPPFRGGPDRPFDDENNRNKQNRRRRMDPNIGRQQGNAWRGVPNWPSPVANGFVPFQHGPHPLGFHPVMQQFPNNPMFGVRPSMDMNQSGVPFHVHDSDRFPGHVRPLGWDGNNPIFGDESHQFWDNNRNFNGGRGWENSRDMWKGPNTGLNTEMPVRHKNDISAHGPGDEEWLGNSVLPAQSDKKQTSVQADSTSIDRSSDVVESDSPKEASKAILEDISDPKTKDADYFSRAYLSMLDISEDLSQYELYSQYAALVGMDQNANAEEDDSKLVIMEDDIDALGKDFNKTWSTSLFCTTNDSIFQSAMSLYKKVKEEVKTAGQDEVPSTVPDLSKVKIEESFDIMGDNLDQVMSDVGERSDNSSAALNIVKREIDPVSIKEEMADYVAQDGTLSLIEVNMDSNEGPNLNDGKSATLPFSGASAEVEIDNVIESGSVNISRIQSPESTH